MEALEAPPKARTELGGRVEKEKVLHYDNHSQVIVPNFIMGLASVVMVSKNSSGSDCCEVIYIFRYIDSIPLSLEDSIPHQVFVMQGMYTLFSFSLYTR